MIQVLHGITWQRPPSIQQYQEKAGENWYVLGVQRVETPGTAGWRHSAKTVYLQEDGTWGSQAHYFSSCEAAETTLGATPVASAPVSALAAALMKAKTSKQ